MSAAPSLKPRPRLLIVDDHSLVRRGLARILAPAFDVVGEAGDGFRAIEQVRKLKPDLILMDFTMPGMTGAEAATVIRKMVPETKIVFLSMHESATIAGLARLAGGDAYLTKGCSAEELIKTLAALFCEVGESAA